jgi:hypothetical protein
MRIRNTGFRGILYAVPYMVQIRNRPPSPPGPNIVQYNLGREKWENLKEKEKEDI